MDTINLLAFCLPLGLFVFWGIVGYAALSLLRTQRHTLQNLLIAPSIGIATTLLPIFWLSRAGLPVRSFAIIMTLILFIISIAILLFRKPLLPFKKYSIFFGIFILALFLTGRPLLEFGFNWVSYCNDDMANYCLRALRFLHYGYSETPNINDLVQGKDYSLFYWFMDVPGRARTGADLLLAWISALTHLTPLQTFMPIILAFHLSLISAAGGFLFHSKRFNKAAITCCILLSFSPLTSLGALYQLIAQVVGLSLLCATLTLLLQPFSIHQKLFALRFGVLFAILISALLISYPEISPFLGFAIILYFSINIIKGWKPKKIVYLFVATSMIFIATFLQSYILNYVLYLKSQITAGIALNSKTSIFPYYLMPSGLANLWGFQPISYIASEPWLSISIILGMILLISIFCFSIWLFFKKQQHPIASITMAMILFFIYLYIKKMGFGLFKIAMYMQPFTLGCFALLISNIMNRSIILSRFFIIFIIMLTIPAQSFYVKQSGSNKNNKNVFIEIPGASDSKINFEVQNLLLSIPFNKTILFDTNNVVLAKFEAFDLKNRKMYFLAQDFFNRFDSVNYENLSPEVFNIYNLIKKQIKLKYQYDTLSFKLIAPDSRSLVNTFQQVKLTHHDQKNAHLITTTPKLSLFNRRHYSYNNNNFISMDMNKIQNHLVFIHSTLGENYYSAVDHRMISLYQLENDYFYPNKTMAAIGQYLVFQIINPSSKVRLIADITTTLNQDKNNSLPSASIIADKFSPLSFVGRGSGRIFSESFSPKIINQFPYITLNMGNKLITFPYKKVGLMNLYGKEVPFDKRCIIGFSRDISLISEEEYINLKAPSKIDSFPTDLADPNLEYSGIYEDGWISEDAFFNLNQPKNSKLVIKGEFPQIHANQTKLSISVDGTKIYDERLIPGIFKIKLIVPNKPGRRKIELHFANTQLLPNGDNRPVAAKIEFLGFEKQL